MNTKNYLYLVWQDIDCGRNYIVGELIKNGGYEFKYGVEVEDAQKKGFVPLVAFPDLSKTYYNNILFPTFSSRLPDKKRVDIVDILNKYGLTNYDEFELLKRGEARLPIDSFCFIDLDRYKVINHLKNKIAEIESVISKEYFNFNDWYFAGGCIYSLWNDKEPKDYDIFAKNKKAVKKIKKYFKLHKDKCNVITKNAISMGKYQFVIKHIGEPEIEVKKFDFKHNMFFCDNRGLKTVSNWAFLDSNNLVFNTERARNVLNIISRIPKFIDRGMEISQSEIFDILELGTRPTKVLTERRNIKQSRKGKINY